MKPANKLDDRPKKTPTNPFRTQEEAQPQQIYRYLSADIKQSMTEKYNHTRTSDKFYKNNIFHSTHKYKVPVDDPFKKLHSQNTTYNDFYSTYRKFTKPYGQLTKHVDNLNRNKSLLRRGQCDTPISFTSERKVTISSNSNKNSRYVKNKAQNCDIQVDAVENDKRNSTFYKTVSTQYKIFRNLLGKERQNKDRKSLNNSLNRMLAAESIYQKVDDFLPIKSKKKVKTFI